MRNKLLTAVATAFVLSSVGLGSYAAHAQPSPGEMRKAAEKKNPAVADAAISKYEDKDAKKQAHKARHYAKVARHKAKVAAKTAYKIDKDHGHH